MNYLITEGYPSAAQKFAHEANIEPMPDLESIEDRVQVREAIHSGDIKTAIEMINELDPEVSSIPSPRLKNFYSKAHHIAMIRFCSCTTHRPFGVLMRKILQTTSVFSLSNICPSYILQVYVLPHAAANAQCKLFDKEPALHFSLLRLQLIELIRKATATPDGDIAPALSFATTHLAPRAPTNPEFLEDLECTMALLIFPPDNLAPPLAALLHPSLRQEVAQRVNKALLNSVQERTKATLFDLVNHRSWAYQKALEAKKEAPERLELGFDPAQNGHEESENGTSHRQHRAVHGNGSADTGANNGWW